MPHEITSRHLRWASPAANPIVEAHRLGQSLWYDSIRRALMTSGALAAMVREGLRGVTSNPAIFEKALSGSADYDGALETLVRGGVTDPKALYERLAIEDIQLAADVLRPVFEASAGVDGYVSLEVSPHLAHDTVGTVAEARRLHAAVARPNVMIKIPGTPAGMPAIATLIGEGISINVTLLFAIAAYEQAAGAYMDGLERLIARGGDPSHVACVASFFVSRIDAFVDTWACSELDRSRDPVRRARLKSLLGRVAIANAKLAYARYQEFTQSARWRTLAAADARPQRLLWASTGAKNPKYPKTLYVDELIGPDTVNTVPEETYCEFRDRGAARLTLTAGLDEARATLETLDTVGLSLVEVTDRLLAEAIEKFTTPFDTLLAATAAKQRAILDGRSTDETYSLGDGRATVAHTLDEWEAARKTLRLWNRDASLWTGDEEAQWLDWLHAVTRSRDDHESIQRIADAIRADGFRHAVLLGMGGSSLAPWALRETMSARSGSPELLVLDSVVPDQIRAVERRIDPTATVFIVSSKSGTTTEPNVLLRYFSERVREAGIARPGSRFVAITDPGTALERLAKRDGFRSIVSGVPGIGGRYSVFSGFGLLPAAIAGFDVAGMLDRAERMVHACGAVVPASTNPGVRLGVVLGTFARLGRDKLTFVLSPGIRALGSWLEQLIAESTGKHGLGIVPVDGERVGAVEVYGTDRLFVHVREAGSTSADEDRAVANLEASGHPVVRLALGDPLDIGQEFFRWQIATAVAGSVLGINPFDQPDVEAAKVATRRLTEAFARDGALERTAPRVDGGTVQLFADGPNAAALGGAVDAQTVEAWIAAHLSRLRAGDYFAITAYLAMTGETDAALQAIRHAVRDARRVATTVGYGPRFLHSTGQLHKGGPNTGVFLQITADATEDLVIPAEPYTFGTLTLAQALGDFDVLCARDRRVLRVHLGQDVPGGLARLVAAVRASAAGVGGTA